MELQDLDAIRNALCKEKDSLVATAEDLRRKLNEIQSRISRIEAAIAALDGTNAKGLPKRQQAKDKVKHSMPAAGKSEVIRYMEAVLEKESVLCEKELKERVEKLAQEDGFTRLGIGLRLREAINDPRFANTASGVRLSLLGVANKVGAR